MRSVSVMLVAGIVWALLTGCAHQKPPQPLQVPQTQLAISHYVGMPFSGSTAGPVPAVSPADALTVEVTLVALAAMPAEPGESLAGQASVIAAMRGSTPIAPNARLIQGVRIAAVTDRAQYVHDLEGGPPGRAARIAVLRAALPRGVTATFAARDMLGNGSSAGEQAIPRRLELSLYRVPGAADAVQVVVLVSDWVSPEHGRDLSSDLPGREAAKPAGATQGAVIAAEAAQLERKLVGGRDRFALVVPLHFSDAQAQAVAAVVEISPGIANAAQQALCDECAQNLAEAARAAANRPTVAPAELPQWPALSAGLMALAQGGRTRPALAFLAGQTKASFCADVALAGDDALLQRLAGQILTRSKAASDPASLGWAMELACLEQAMKLLEQGQLPPELAAALTRHAGEVGRHASSLDQVLKNVGGIDELERRLVGENLIYLEDSSPSSRVRAFDWLSSRGQAPAGYDPLASPKERRTALERATTAPTTQGAKAP